MGMASSNFSPGLNWCAAGRSKMPPRVGLEAPESNSGVASRGTDQGSHR
jgi:hypothetical protein